MKQKILVTGGTGTLGQKIIRQLPPKDFEIIVLSSKVKPELTESVSVFQADLTDVASLEKGFPDADVVVHCASNPMNAQLVDVEGTQNMLSILNKRALKHFIYISIVGVDQSNYPYYVAKYEVEKMIQASGLPFTNLRATQFHDLVLYRLILPADKDDNRQMVIPANMRFQSIDIHEVATKILDLIERGPSNSTLSIGGPEILTLEEMTQEYLNHRQKQKEIVTNPNDTSFASFKSGVNLCLEKKYGQITWKDYLSGKL